MKGCTAFPVIFKNGLYLVKDAHCYSGARSGEILAHRSADVALVGAQIFNETINAGKIYPLILPDNYINVSMGDKLVAVGYDENSSLRIWVASTYSVSGSNILTGGDQMYGMSGCAVFNGCGLVGIAVSNNLKFINTTIVKSGAGVIHVSTLYSLLQDPRARKFELTHLTLFEPTHIPTKLYCSL